MPAAAFALRQAEWRAAAPKDQRRATLRHTRRVWQEAVKPARDFAILPHRTRPPIFIIGYTKCGTTALHRWFAASGIRSLHHGGYHRKNNIEVRMVENIVRGADILDGLDHFEAFSDLNYASAQEAIDANEFFAQMYACYPEAYFIFNHRPVEAWLNSRRAHGNGTMVARYARALNRDIVDIPDIWRAAFLRHAEAVRHFFRAHPARFLDVAMDGDAAQKIATFLDPIYMLDPSQLGHSNRSRPPGLQAATPPMFKEPPNG